jgi:hypothetical protein
VAELHPSVTPEPDAVAWATWSTHLADALTGLADKASVTVTGPAGSERPIRVRKARLGGFIPAKLYYVVIEEDPDAPFRTISNDQGA